MAAVTRSGSTARVARKRAPPRVIRFVMRERNSSVGLPGRMPGMKPPFLRRKSAVWSGRNWKAV